MFDIVFLEKLPVPIQIAFLLGVLLVGGFSVRRGLLSAGQSQENQAMEVVRLGGELADAKVRSDLVEVVRITRESLEQRIDAVANDLRGVCRAIEAESKKDRELIYKRLADLERDVSRRSSER